MKKRILCIVGALVLVCLVALPLTFWQGEDSGNGDWPQWRYDAGRGAASPRELPGKLHLQWMRQLPAPRPAWPPSQPSLRFDLSYCPVAAGSLLFVPSMVTDTLTAYDTETGEERWRFTADGPVRLAPIAHRGKVYFGSDDGYLYCLDAARGTLVWRFRGGPSDRKVLGNGRLISTWPVRGGPVLHRQTIYFTAGIWPFMGIFVHAVDAETGRAVWTNSGEGSRYQTHPHNSPAFGGLAPRGHLVATEHGLIVPGGRTAPGGFDLKTGKLRYFHYAKKGGRSSRISASGEWFFYDGGMLQIADGKRLLATAAGVHDGGALYSVAADHLVARRLKVEERTVEETDRRGRTSQSTQAVLEDLWKCPLGAAPRQLFLKAGSRLVGGGEGVVAMIQPGSGNRAAEVVWQGTFRGKPWTMLAADNKLFVVTVEGRIYCFGAKDGDPRTYGEATAQRHRSVAKEPSPDADAWQRRAEALCKRTGVTGGYGVVFGLGTGRLAEALVRGSKLHLIAVDPDAEKVEAFRRRMQDAGLYGTRVAAHVGDPAEYPLPPYLAGLVISEDPGGAGLDRSKGLVNAVLNVLRPYGGTAHLPIDKTRLSQVIQQAGPTNVRVEADGKQASLLIREGALPGAADWTHHYADAGNSVVSGDKRVKAPLGLLWFGGPANDEVLPRHGHGPSPQVAAGRLMIEGPDMLRALDVYTGRLLWQRQLPELGKFFNVTGHQPGAGEVGSNYVSLADAVYVVYGERILKLGAASGKTLKEFKLEAGPDDPSPNWGYLAAWDDLLVATSTPVAPGGRHDLLRILTAPGKAAAYRPLIPPDDDWRYLAGTDPDGDWTAVDYDARGWRTGPPGFGYGDGDDRTVLGDMPDEYSRVYIRKTFDAAAAEKATEMVLLVNYDDGFIAYLNGREVARASVGRGRGNRASKISSHEAGKPETFAIGDFRRLLRAGGNVIALEGHNTSLDSSDFSLDPLLVIKVDAEADNGPPQQPPEPASVAERLTPVRYASASRRLVVLDRHSGKQKWDRRAEYGFRHNNIALGADKVFCIDGLSPAKREALNRRGREVADYRPRLLALDLRTGKEVWSTGENVFGTFLNYSAQHDVLLQAGSDHGDRAKDEADTGMIAYRGNDGQVLWKELKRRHRGPCMLHGDTIIAQGPAYSLLTGKRKTRKHPLTGKSLEWKYTRNYGCNTAVASEHLITFRSAAAGFYDLAGNGGTGNFGGFKSGCTSNLIVAGGLLNAPEYTRTCTCNYQNQTSLALVHDPEVEIWTFNDFAWDGAPVRRVGINLGAPGDRPAADGTLWLDYPSRGGPSPDIPVHLKPADAQDFCHHSSRIEVDVGGRELGWVAASGLDGVEILSLTLARKAEQARNYTVRLHFAEPKDVPPGRRVFDVSLQGKRVLRNFDVVEQAGGVNRAVVKEFRGVEVVRQLRVSLEKKGSLPPVICGVEVAAEGW